MNRIFSMVLLAAVLICGLAQSGFAGSGRNFGQIYTECGIGAMLFQHQKWAGLAAVSNIIWDWGTTAISSELTTPDSCMGGKVDKMAAFIHDSYDSIENDLAKGSGEHLDTLMLLAGKTESDPQFIAAVRKDFAALVATEGYAQQTKFDKAEALFNVVVAHADQLS